ncbi:MAG: GTPase HflX [Caldisericales bacterium]|nr:GTPase HflX [Caldisericia bacterium]NMD14773.1 GTPase HflX [Caldisericales bacterium]
MSKVFIVGLRMKEDDQHEALESFSELMQLARTLDMEIVGKGFQVIREPTHSHLLGKGKVEELAQEIASLNPERVLVDFELSPLQCRNLEESWGRPVLDRHGLIIEVFSKHATTSEGKLQVELALLKYKLPRLSGRNLAYDQQTGGGGSAYLRGAGERAIDIARRQIRSRIRVLEKKIELIARHREIKSKRREKSDVPLVSLVGYTNAGKSTLLNSLTGANVLTQNKLFSTLDTTVRARIHEGQKILFADTVGFIRNLPVDLVAAFRSTLEEVLSSDVILHVFDATNPDWERHIEVAQGILDDLGASHIPTLYVANKSDLASEEKQKEISDHLGDVVFVSALERQGLDILLGKLSQNLFALKV